MFKLNDYVSRISYNHDIIFKITSIKDDEVIIEGIEHRLIATASISDLVLVDKEEVVIQEKKALNRIKNITKLYRHKMHMTGKILHIDSDEKYLNKCLKLYEQLSLPAYGVYMREELIKDHILDLIDNAKNAAFQDPRFEPLTPQELVNLAIDKGTPVLRDAATEVKTKAISVAKETIERLEKNEKKEK